MNNCGPYYNGGWPEFLGPLPAAIRGCDLIPETLDSGPRRAHTRGVPRDPEEPTGVRCLQRDDALVPLSRDHHQALIHALGLRRAAESHPVSKSTGAVAVAEAFLAFYDQELLAHMADEEEAVLPAAQLVDPDNARRLRAEHEDLCERAALLRQALEDGEDPRPLMGELGQRLHDHVRFEERLFFESLQDLLSPEQLEGVGRAIEARRTARGRGIGCALHPRAG